MIIMEADFKPGALAFTIIDLAFSPACITTRHLPLNACMTEHFKDS